MYGIPRQGSMARSGTPGTPAVSDPPGQPQRPSPRSLRRACSTDPTDPRRLCAIALTGRSRIGFSPPGRAIHGQRSPPRQEAYSPGGSRRRPVPAPERNSYTSRTRRADRSERREEASPPGAGVHATHEAIVESLQERREAILDGARHSSSRFAPSSGKSEQKSMRFGDESALAEVRVLCCVRPEDLAFCQTGGPQI
jgi:hypothetical protein